MVSPPAPMMLLLRRLDSTGEGRGRLFDGGEHRLLGEDRVVRAVAHPGSYLHHDVVGQRHPLRPVGRVLGGQYLLSGDLALHLFHFWRFFGHVYW